MKVVMLKLDRRFKNAGDCLTAGERWEKSGVSLHVADTLAETRSTPRPQRVGSCLWYWPVLPRWNAT